jgi:Skp family chaperone for outer membrane proteins
MTSWAIFRRRETSAAALFVAMLVALFATPCAAQAKVVYVSSARLFEAAPGWEQAEKRFMNGFDSVRASKKRMNDSLETLMSAYARDEATLSPAARSSRRSAIDRQRASFEQRGDQMDKVMQSRKGATMDSIATRIRVVLSQLRAKKGYGAILDFDSGGILAADSSFDVTNEAIAVLKR